MLHGILLMLFVNYMKPKPIYAEDNAHREQNFLLLIYDNIISKVAIVMRRKIK